MRVSAFFLFLLIAAFPFGAFAAAVGNESHNFGSACSPDKANGSDWDTIAQCKNGTWQRAPYYFGTSTDTCNSTRAGVMQWTGTDMRLCTGTTWEIVGLTDPCTQNPVAGTVCRDGTVYVGLTPDGNVPMYIMRCDIGQTWDGSSCTGTRTTFPFGTAGVTMAVSSSTSGKSNTDYISANYSSYIDGSVSGVPAINSCANAVANGHDDWYLPAPAEMSLIWTSAGSSIAGLNATYSSSFDTTYNRIFWTSQTYYSYGVYVVTWNSGTVTPATFRDSSWLGIRCARHG